MSSSALPYGMYRGADGELYVLPGFRAVCHNRVLRPEPLPPNVQRSACGHTYSVRIYHDGKNHYYGAFPSAKRAHCLVEKLLKLIDPKRLARKRSK